MALHKHRKQHKRNISQLHEHCAHINKEIKKNNISDVVKVRLHDNAHMRYSDDSTLIGIVIENIDSEFTYYVSLYKLNVVSSAKDILLEFLNKNKAEVESELIMINNSIESVKNNKE